VAPRRASGRIRRPRISNIPGLHSKAPGNMYEWAKSAFPKPNRATTMMPTTVLRCRRSVSGAMQFSRILVSQQEAGIAVKGAVQRGSNRTKATSRRIGALTPRYSFALNAQPEVRFTTCPGCQAKTRLRKLPLAIHTEGLGLFILRKSCRMCVACDMLIVHQDELEPLIRARLRNAEGSSRPLDYLVLGTVDSQVWRRGLTDDVSFDELLRNMADFSRHMQIEQIGRGWEPAK